MSITDIAACADLAQRHGLLLGVDNTFATPVLTRPLELGADIVMHSATKYLGGHSDVLGGALVVRDQQLLDRLYFIQNATGAVLGPFESFLLREASRRWNCACENNPKRPSDWPSSWISTLASSEFSIRGCRRIRDTNSPADKWTAPSGRC